MMFIIIFYLNNDNIGVDNDNDDKCDNIDNDIHPHLWIDGKWAID